jgi:hypothetical protein
VKLRAVDVDARRGEGHGSDDALCLDHKGL